MSITSNVALLVMQERREVGRDQLETGAQTTLHAERELRAAEAKADSDSFARIVGLVDDVVTTAVKTAGKVGDFQDALKDEPPAAPEKTEGDWDPALAELKKGAYDFLSSEDEARDKGAASGSTGRALQAEGRAAQAHARTGEDLAELMAQARIRFT